MLRSAAVCVLGLMYCASAAAREPIRLANNPALSPQGQWLAFDWNGDIWLTSPDGGEAKQLTAHAGRDSLPKFSPDGKTIAFISDRDGSPLVYEMPFEGGAPTPISFHTAGASLQEWTPDGNALLIKATRDLFWRHGERFFTINASKRSAEQMLFDDYGTDGTLSPDGTKLLFTREGENWWRKGYQGSRVAQIWLFDRATKSFSKILHQPFGCRSPLWKPDGKGFYYVCENARGSNLCEFDFVSKSSKQLTTFKEDSVVFPCITRDGSLIVFRHLFDLYRFRPANNEVKKIDVFHNVDRVAKKKEHRMLNTASAVSFAQDGLEMAFISGGDLWVMDTELREPRQITHTAGEEGNPIFSPDGQAIFFTSDFGDHFTIARAARKDPKRFWWQNKEFILDKLINVEEALSKLKLSPDGKKLAYVQGRGDLWVADLDAGKNHRVFSSWNSPDYDWSPDGKWFVCALFDEEFNRDIWLLRSDGSGKPHNVSRHPYEESNPAWSPDGKVIAFTGRRASGESGANICLVYLNPEDEEKTSRDRKLDKALEKMKGRASASSKSSSKPDESKEEAKKPAPKEIAIDFERLHERVKRVPLANGFATSLFWSPDSRKLAFTSIHEGKLGTSVIDVGESLTPKTFLSSVGSQATWLKQGNQIVWLVSGVPTSTPGTGAPAPSTTPDAPAPAPAGAPAKGPLKKAGVRPTGVGSAPASGGSYTFSVRQAVDLSARNAAIFDTCWHVMRDHWYDSKLGNNDWNAVRAKYRDMASQSPDAESVTTVVQMMLGELNGSHLGFQMSAGEVKVGRTVEPRDTTAHLGVRFDDTFAGPGLRVRDVLPNGPADTKRGRLRPGEIVLKIDGMDVQRDMDLSLALNGPTEREVLVLVQSVDGKTREVSMRPISYAAAQTLLYDLWLRQNRALVAEASKDKFGYLHISQMAMPNFRKFEEELVSEGAGKDGLIIDVRENPGGSITDHLLTALTQPVHAITVPRGGIPGYPLDRKVYISWHKPIVVLCNQNSGSNAEIFSHAIKTLKRGRLVGVPTAGAVVSTGSVTIPDAGVLRLPTRGWFLLNNGEDMEKHGAVPDFVLWPLPGELPRGKDLQLAKAIEVLQMDVSIWRERPIPQLRKSTDRPLP